MQENDDLPKKLKRLRKENNLTLDKLHQLTLISIPTLSRYEKGTRTPKTEQMEKLATALGVKVGYLQDEVDYYSDAHDTAIEFRNYIHENFYNGSKIKVDTGFYGVTNNYVSELTSSLPKLSLSETKDVYNALSTIFDETLNLDVNSLSDEDKELYSKIDNLHSLYFARIENLKGIEIVQSPSHIFTYTNSQLAKRDDASINEGDEYTIAYRNMYDLVYYLHLIQDNLSLVNLDKVDNAIAALQNLIGSNDVAISDDLKKFIDSYKSN